jgi:hypothetical protein
MITNPFDTIPFDTSPYDTNPYETNPFNNIEQPMGAIANRFDGSMSNFNGHVGEGEF